MPKKLDRPIKLESIKLYIGTKETLKRFYATIGWNAAAREILDLHARKLLEIESRKSQGESVDFTHSAVADAIIADLIDGISSDGAPST